MSLQYARQEDEALAPSRRLASRLERSHGDGQARVKPLPLWRLKRVLDLVESHLDEPLDLTMLATAAGLSRMHFAAQFRVATGRRPHDFLLQQRIERSMAMMSTTTIALAELALAVGFQSQSHFSTVFKRHTGQTPAQWRKATCGGAMPPH